MPLTWSQEAEGTIEVIFVDISEDVGALCDYLLVEAEYDHLEPSNRRKNQSVLCTIPTRPGELVNLPSVTRRESLRVPFARFLLRAVPANACTNRSSGRQT
jgi:hypothetical protein